VLLLLFFGTNKVRSTLEKRSTKAAEVGESSKAVIGGAGFGGSFYNFFPKISNFRHILA